MELYGIKIIPDIFILVFIGVVFIIICLHVSHYVFAFSSPFTRQEIIDPKPNDWTLVNTPKESTFQVNNFFNNTPVNLLYEQNITACEKAKEKDEKENHFHPPDISSVTYHSDGKTLNATIWLSSPFIDPPQNAEAWLSPTVQDAPWYQIRYGLSIAVHSTYDTQGTDYSLMYRWDALNKNTTLGKNWTRTVMELSPEGDQKVLEPTKKYNIFSANGQKRYIDLSLDLTNLLYPDQYDLLFYAYDYFIENGHVCPLVDITPRVYNPPPVFTISTSPSSLEIRPGEEKSITLKLQSSANIKSYVHFFTNQTDKLKDKIKLNITSSNIAIPTYGIVTSDLNLKVAADTKPSSYQLPIFSNIYILTEAKPRRSIFTGEFINNSASENLNKTSILTITVIPPMNLLDYINSILNSWGTPVKELIGLAAAVGTIGGVGPHIVRLIGKWRTKEKDKENEKRKGDNGNVA